MDISGYLNKAFFQNFQKQFTTSSSSGQPFIHTYFLVVSPISRHTHPYIRLRVLVVALVNVSARLMYLHIYPTVYTRIVWYLSFCNVDLLSMFIFTYRDQSIPRMPLLQLNLILNQLAAITLHVHCRPTVLHVQYHMYCTTCTVPHVQYHMYSTTCTVPHVLYHMYSTTCRYDNSHIKNYPNMSKSIVMRQNLITTCFSKIFFFLHI